MQKAYSNWFFKFIFSALAALGLVASLYLFSFLFIGAKPLPTKKTEQPIHTLAQASFEDVTLIAGITHSHIQNSGQIRDLIDGMAGGACAADFNNDGWVDLLFAAGGGQTRFYGRKSWWQGHKSVVLYQNNQGKFESTPVPELVVTGSTTACATADFNLDGLIDIIIATTDTDYLFANQGNMEFSKIEEFSRVATPVWTSHVSVADINGDGLPDVHLAHFLKYRQNLKNLELSSGFTEQHHLQMDPGKFDGLANQILINGGNFTFSDKSAQLGIAEHAERTAAASFLDIDQDGDIDLLEYNLGDQPLRTYLQQSNPMKFKEIIRQDWGMRVNNVHYSALGQQIFDPQPLWLATRGAGLANLSKHAPDYSDELSWDLGLTSHAYIYQQQWGGVFADFNNDGYSDIAIASGAYNPDTFSPKMSIPMPDLCATRQFSNRKSNQTAFTVSPCLPNTMISSRGAITLDYNNDGKMDLLFVANNDFPLLLKNTSQRTGNWISLSASSSYQIDIETPEHKPLSTTSYQQALFGNHDPRWHLGLGQLESVTVKVRNTRQQLISEQKLATNEFYQFDGETWLPLTYASPKLDLKEYADLLDIATFIRATTNQVKSEQWLQYAIALLGQATTNQQNELAELITKQLKPENIPFYLTVLENSNPTLADAAAFAIGKLEQEYSTARLLPWLEKQDDKQYCRIAEVFSHWFDEEEAVTSGKQRAIPFLIRGLTSPNANIVSCSATALGNAEHINGAFALLQVLQKATDQTQPTLINALGKIRQNAAIPVLLSLLNETENVAVIQQSIIALSRLNFQELDNSVIHSDASRSHLYWLAITMLDKAQDGIVIDNQRRLKWLDNFSIPNFEEFQTEQSIAIYLQAALLGRAAVSSNNLIDGTETDTILRQKIALLLTSKQIQTEDITHLLNTSLTSSEIHILSDKIPQHYRFDQQLSELGVLQGMGAWFSLTQEQQRQLAKLLENDEIKQIPSAAARYFLNQCASTNLPFQSSAQTSWAKSVQELVMSCQFLDQAKLSSEQNSQTDVATKFLSDENHVDAILSNLKLVSENLSGVVLNRLSTLILYRSELSEQKQSEWALSHFKIDNLSRTWLFHHIALGDNKILGYVLDKHGYSILAANMDIEHLLNTSMLDPKLKVRLGSYQLVEPFQDAGELND